MAWGNSSWGETAWVDEVSVAAATTNNISLYKTIGFGMSVYGLQIMLAYLMIGILL